MTAVEKTVLDKFGKIDEKAKAEFQSVRTRGGVGAAFLWLRRRGFGFDAETNTDLAARFLMLLQELEG